MKGRDFTGTGWAPERVAASPMLAHLAPYAAPLPRGRWPTREDLNRVLGTRAGVRFAAPAAGGADYEARITAHDEVEVRAADWHDLFNALTWAAWPQAKRAVSRLHARHRIGAGAGRGPVRDAATLFDENGVAVVCEDPELVALLGGFRWRELFVARRDAVLRNMRFLVFGHALAVKALAPYVGMTGHALVLAAAPAEFATGAAGFPHALDGTLAAAIATLGTPRELQPLPVLGVPGWWPANASPTFYDNPAYFRPGRRQG